MTRHIFCLVSVYCSHTTGKVTMSRRAVWMTWSYFRRSQKEPSSKTSRNDSWMMLYMYLFYSRYKNAHMQYTETFSAVKIENFIGKIFDHYTCTLAQSIDSGYTLEVLTSTHNLSFGSKIRKIVYLYDTPVLLYKSGV